MTCAPPPHAYTPRPPRSLSTEHTLEVKFNLVNALASQFGATFPTNGYLSGVQLHFHSPSEHTINGAHYPLELHIVNLNLISANGTTGALNYSFPASVIGVMFGYTCGSLRHPLPPGLPCSAAQSLHLRNRS